MFRKPVNTVSVTLDDGGYNRYLLIVHSANSESIFPDVTDMSVETTISFFVPFPNWMMYENCSNRQKRPGRRSSTMSEWRTYIPGRHCRSRMCALRGLAAVTSECPAAFRRSAPVKGLRPLRGCRRYSYFKSTIYFCANMDYYISER